MTADEATTAAAPLDDEPPPGDDAALPPGVARLERDECYLLMASAEVGRLAFVHHGWPLVLPVNVVVDGQDLLLRTTAGSSLAPPQQGRRVAFEVDGLDEVYQSGWSVVVQGIARAVQGPDSWARAEALGLRPWAAGPRDRLVRVTPLRVTGRRLDRAWTYPARPPC